MIAGCYTLDLYCDSPVDHEWGDMPHTFIAEHGSRCRSKARKQGWILNVKKGVAICPACAKKGLKAPAKD